MLKCTPRDAGLSFFAIFITFEECLYSKCYEVQFCSFDRSALVPVYSFGENDLFSQISNPKGSWLRHFQTKFMKAISFAPVLFHGRGIFQYNFGFLPYRHPVTTIGEFFMYFII